MEFYVYKDKELARQLTLTGTDKEWRTEEIILSPSFSTFFLRLYFAQAGIWIRELKVELVQSLEEEIRRAREAMA